MYLYYVTLNFPLLSHPDRKPVHGREQEWIVPYSICAFSISRAIISLFVFRLSHTASAVTDLRTDGIEYNYSASAAASDHPSLESGSGTVPNNVHASETRRRNGDIYVSD